MIYFVLDAYNENDIEDPFINTVLSDMNPFVWADIGSADPAMYSEYQDFLNGREITDYSGRLAPALKCVQHRGIAV